MSDTDDAACTMMVAVFVVIAAQQKPTMIVESDSSRWSITDPERIVSAAIGVDTPPPRRV